MARSRTVGRIGVSVASFALVCTSVCTSLCSVAVHAQDVLAEMYGRGVHAYHAGRYQDAHRFLSVAVRQGSQDPRVYYFRGLAQYRLGRPDEARMDFGAGARLEALASRPVPVSKALQRIQGGLRIEIEVQRQEARIALRDKQLAKRAQRYEQLKIADAEVLRVPGRKAPATAPKLAPTEDDQKGPFAGGKSDLAGGTPNKAGAGAGAGAGKAEVDEPFGTPDAKDDAKPFGGDDAKPAVPAKPAANDPFGGGDAKPAAPAVPAKPAADDPFGGGDAKPAAPAVPAKPAANDPFGGDDAKPAVPAKPAASDPFGGDGAAKPPAAKPPVATPPVATPPAAAGGDAKGAVGVLLKAAMKMVPGSDDSGEVPAVPVPATPAEKNNDNVDPFGDDAKQPAAAKPAAGNDPFGGGAATPANDPFGGAKPAKPAANDPFGGGDAKPANKDPFGNGN